jgi:hypothetical protein
MNLSIGTPPQEPFTVTVTVTVIHDSFGPRKNLAHPSHFSLEPRGTRKADRQITRRQQNGKQITRRQKRRWLLRYLHYQPLATVTERNPDQGRVNILPERESGRVGSCSSHESTKSRSASSAAPPRFEEKRAPWSEAGGSLSQCVPS